MAFTLELTGAQHELVERTHRFAADVMRPVAAEYDRDEEFPWAGAGEGRRGGLLQPALLPRPDRRPHRAVAAAVHGGAVLGLRRDRAGDRDAGAGAVGHGPGGHARTSCCAGRRSASAQPGDLKLAALCISEPQGGSDVKNLQTTATRDGDDWVLDGHKIWIGNGGIADVHVVNATVDPELGHRGQALFVVPGGTPGLEMVRKLEKLGCRASHTAELRFDGCRIPADHLLGGYDALENRLKQAREGDAGRAPRPRWGPSSRPGRWWPRRRWGSRAPRWSSRATTPSEREAFGEPIIENQGVSFQLADVAAELDAARLLTWRAAWMAAEKVPWQHGEGSMSKLKASEVAVRATELAVQVCGGYGYVRDKPAEKWYRDAKLYTIFEGTSEIQRLVIGRALARGRRRGAAAPPASPGAARAVGRCGAGHRARSKAGAQLTKTA